MSATRSDEGAIAVLVAILALVLFGFGALVVDLGMARDLEQRATDSADAAALAGSADLRLCTGSRCTAAVAAVKSSASDNFASGDGTPLAWNSCRATPPSGWSWRQRRSRTQCIQFGWSGPVSGSPAVVFVAIPPRTSRSAFGGVFGFSGVTVQETAVAGTASRPVPPCALCILDSMDVSGGSLSISGGGSAYATDATASGGTFTVFGAGIYLTNPGSGTGFFPPPVVTDQPVADPFAATSPPTPAPPDLDVDECGGGTDVLVPGTYTDDLVVVGTCTLGPGVYEFEKDLEIEPAGRLQGAGVTLAFDNNADLSVDGGSVVLGPPATGQILSVHFPSTGSGTIVVDSGSVTTGAAFYASRRTLEVTSATVRINGTAVLDELEMRSGTVVISSPGSGSAQSGPRETALVQ